MLPNRLRRAFGATLLFALALGSSWVGAQESSPERIGVLMLHGKNPGSNQDPHFGLLKPKFEAAGMLVAFPDMPWSRTRYLDGDWDGVMAEVASQVAQLKQAGATRIVLVGHSMGAPAALSHAARKAEAHALVLMAPGHVPTAYYNVPSLGVRESIDKARELVAAGKGGERTDFSDNNQGRRHLLFTTAQRYLSYFDPTSDAEMSVTAPRIPPALPVLVVIGDKDVLYSRIKPYLFDKLPANPRSQLLEVKGTHLSTPRDAAEQTVTWIKQVFSTAP